MSAPAAFAKKPPQAICSLRRRCFHGFSGRRYAHAARKKLVATANRCEGACNRTGEPSVTFCEKGGARERADGLFLLKNKPEQSGLCSDVGTTKKMQPPCVPAKGW